MRITKTTVRRATAVLLFSATLITMMAGSASAAFRPRSARHIPDALTVRAAAEVDAFAAWLRKNAATGYVGEVGWPSDDPRWNVLAEAWFKRADTHQLSVTTWVAGEWAGGHQLGSYARSTMRLGSPLDTARSNALVAERHIGKSKALRGVNTTGPEMGTPAIDASSAFSNRNVGILGQTYQYDSAATYEFLARRGIQLVRLPFRWERIQRTPFGTLDVAEMARLEATVHAAADAGVKVVLDMHNFGGYYLHDDATGKGVRRAIGSRELPVAAFVDVWAKLVRHFAGDPAVHGYALMNEPIGLPHVGRVTPAKLWESASQKVLTAIRAEGDRRFVSVGGYDWSSMANWAKNHPKSWIKDPARNFSYEAHQYFDARHSGVYGSYAAELATVQARA